MDRFQPSLSHLSVILALLLTPCMGPVLATEELDPALISNASGTTANLTDDGVVRISWSRADVKVTVDGMLLPPAAGLGSWAAFTATEDGAMVMGDTVVFQDEVDAAMDAAFAHDLSVTALHNHFFYDSPKVYFMHIGGAGETQVLASGVKAVWDAIRAVRDAEPQPASGFGGAAPVTGDLDADALSEIVGHPAEVNGGVAKITIARRGHAHGRAIGGSMGLTTWAAFSGSDERAAIDGDLIMTGEEVQPVLRALRKGGVHVVALHNHMIGERPGFYFSHYWGTGPAADLARAFRGALDEQAAASEAHAGAP
jgi:hypothetical protein